MTEVLLCDLDGHPAGNRVAGVRVPHPVRTGFVEALGALPVSLPSQRAGCDPRLDAIVLKAMQQAPDRRYQSTQEMKTDVDSARVPVEIPPAVAQSAVSAPPRVVEKAVALVPKKNRPPLWVAFAVVLVSVLGAGGFFAKHRGKGTHALLSTEPASMSPSIAATEPVFRLLFDGKTLDGWRSAKEKTPPSGWAAVEGALMAGGQRGCIVTVEEFDDFELELEWRVSADGNGGVYFRVAPGFGDYPVNVPQLQLCAPNHDRDTKGGLIYYPTGSLYELIPAREDRSPR